MRLVFVGGLVVAIFSACGGDPEIPSVFEDSVKEAAPVLKTGAREALRLVEGAQLATDPGTVQYQIYAALCDPDDADCDAGVNNVYHALADLDSVAEETEDGGSAAGELVVPFFATTHTYSRKKPKVAVAWRSQGSEKSILYFADKGDGTSVTRAEINEDTGDVFVELAGYWTSDGVYALRVEIDGNRRDHAFALRIASNDPDDTSKPSISFRGAGVSRGSGNVFLFRVSSVNTPDGETHNGYHCVDAETSIDVEGNDPAEVHSACGGADGEYAAAIDAMAEFTRSDLPSSRIRGTF